RLVAGGRRLAWTGSGPACYIPPPPRLRRTGRRAAPAPGTGSADDQTPQPGLVGLVPRLRPAADRAGLGRRLLPPLRDGLDPPDQGAPRRPPLRGNPAAGTAAGRRRLPLDRPVRHPPPAPAARGVRRRRQGYAAADPPGGRRHPAAPRP